MPTLADYISLCQSRNYVLPSVYLLPYNLLWRHPETKLLPFLRQHGISVSVCGGLAGGLLAGRFAPEQQTHEQSARPQGGTYGKPRSQAAAAAADLVALAGPAGLSPPEASLRWLCWHAGLEPGDEVLLGGGNEEELRENVRAVERGPLSAEPVGGIDRIWEGIRTR
jgi:aryl-alcohol dehydrogenase-like predicted oxidoreductase